MKLLALLGQLLPKHDAGEQGSMVESTTVAPVSVTQAAEFPGQRDTVIIGTTHGISQEEYRIGQFHLKLHQAQVAAEQQRRLRNLALTERMLLNHKAMSFVERNPDLRYVEGVVVDEAVALPGATVSSLPGPGQVIRLSAGGSRPRLLGSDDPSSDQG